MKSEKLSVKEVMQIVIMVTAMHFGFYDMYRTLWLATGQPCTIWLQVVIILLAGATNYLFIRWCGSEKNEKQRICRRDAKRGR